MKTVYIGLGSNIEPRQTFINKSVDLLDKCETINVVKTSSLYETKADTIDSQPDYINAVVEIETSLDPEILICKTKEIENQCDRIRIGFQSPRTLDIDILLYSNQMILSPQLIVPHPRMLIRGFVMIPLAEIAPNVIHPQEEKSMAQLASEIQYDGIIKLSGGAFWIK